MKWESRDRVRARKVKKSLERHVADESLREPQVKSGWGWADQMLSTVALFPSQSASPAGCSTHFRHQGVTETWKYRITEKLSWGPAVLWKFTTQAVGESQTSPSHQLFKCSAAFQSEGLNNSLLLYWPRQPPSKTHHRHPSYCYVVPFSLSARKMNGTGECWFVFGGNQYLVDPKHTRGI